MNELQAMLDRVQSCASGSEILLEAMRERGNQTPQEKW
jgi:hypothetical protein